MMTDAVVQSKPSHARWITAFSMLIVGIVSFLLYSRALGFAFFNDDPTGHFAWMESRGILDYLRSSADYGYYRPIVFITLQSLVDTAGYNTLAFHALLLGLQAANAALLWLLSYRLANNGLYAWATALIFAFTPFNYEAVAYVASLTHPLLLFWLLLTLLFYQQARRTLGDNRRAQRLLFYSLAMITFILGLLTHENGLFIGLALVGIEWLEQPPKGFKESLWRPFLLYLLVIPLFLLLWWSIPKTSEQTLPTISNWLSNLVPFLQTLAFPLMPLFDLTSAQTTALTILAVLALVFTFLAARLAKAVGLWLFGLGWFVFSALPSTLFLTPDYLYGSPRLQYLPAVGAAMLWAMPVLALARFVPKDVGERLAGGGAALVYILVIILPPVVLVNCELDFYAEASRIARQMSALGEQAPAGHEILFANVPVFFSSYDEYPQGCQNPYPWTPVGVVLLPEYAQARDFVRFNGGPDRSADAVTIDAYAPGWHTYGKPLAPDQLRASLASTTVYVFDLNAGEFFSLSDAWLLESAGEEDPAAIFGDTLQLHSAGVAPLNDDNELLVHLTWQLREGGDVNKPLTIFVHLYDQDGHLLAQDDSPPARNFIPRSWWSAKDLVVDTHTIAVEEEMPSGPVKIGVGVYDPLTAERYSAFAGPGLEALANDVYIIAELNLP